MPMPMELKVTPDSYQALVETPGIARDQIRLSFEDGYLTISAEQKNAGEQHGDKNEQVLVSERSYGHVCRQIHMPTPIDASQIKAEYNHGLLKITMPKVDARKEPNLIPIH